ncbi:MAG: Ig-like domain-containing protein, partial [Planctomycetota bacterium]
SYSFNLVPAGQGLVTAVVQAGAFTDAADNNNIASPPLSRIYDSVSPTVLLDSAAPDPTNISPLLVTVTLSEPSINFTEEDISLTNATVSGFSGSGTSYSFNLVPAGQGLVSAVIQAGTFTDAAGNGNVTSSSLSRTYDSVSPTVTLDSAAPDPTNISPIPVTVTLSEPSTNFAGEDMTTTNATVSDFSGSGTSYSFNLVPSGQGLVSAMIQAGAFTDAAGNGNVASSPLSRTYDTVSPSVSSVAVQTGLTVDVTFSEAMGAGATDASNYSLSGSGQGSLATNPDTVHLQSGTTYRLTWNSGDMIEGGFITITVENVQDLVGNLIGTPNSGTHAGGGIVTPPTVIYVDPCSGFVIGRPNVDIEVAFSEIVVGVDASDMVLSGDAAAIASVATPSDQGGNTWRFPVTRLVEGTLDVSLAPDGGDIEDIAGNDLANVMWSYEVVFGQKKIYWTNTGYGKIQRANPEIPSGETAATRTDIEDIITGLTSPYDITIDARRGKMYWTDPEVRKIQCANLDGSGVEDLITDLDSPTGIAVDVFRRKIYWTEPNLGKVQRANPDGSGVEDLIIDLNSPSGIGIDVSRGKVYWTSISDGKIQGANLDGSGVEDYITGLTNPTGITLDGDPNWGMYWTDYGAKKIQRGDYPDLVITEDCLIGLSGPWDITAGGIDAGVFRDNMYWTDVSSNQIQYAVKSGYGGAEDFITTGLLAPRGIVFYRELLTIFVDDDANGANDGSSWADAFTDLQDA